MMKSPKRRYIKGFDGLRALAVGGVILFHLMPTKFVGGWLGVPLFFVISGYLITDLLIQEYDQNYRISVIQFYKRRIKRLYPALVGMLFVVVTVILLFDRDLIYNLRPIIETNLFYVYNFWSIGHGQSYFQQFDGASPFTHLWSLSIEGQFYLIWPLIVWGILRLRFKKVYVASALAFFSLISAITMAVLYSPTMINRVYYGTDTRLFAILLGTALAFVWPSSKLTSNANQHIRYYLNGVGIIALLTFCVAMAALNGQQPNTYYCLMYLISIVGTILVAVTAHPASLFSKLFDNKILAYLGTRSYSIYLYQLPIFVFYEKLVPNYQPNTWHTITEVILVLFVSEISYRYIENIFRNGLKLRQLGSWLIHSRNRFFFALTITLVFFLFIAHGLADKRANQDQPQTALQQKLSKNKKEVAKRNKAAKNSANQSTVPSNKNQTSTDDKKIIDTYALNGNQYLYFKKMSFTAIGDSVMLDAAPYLQDINPNVIVNAKVGRQAYEAPGLVAEMAHNNQLSENILVGLGTNGEIRRSDLDRMMKTFGAKRQVYWVNNFVQSKPWQKDNNAMLQKADKDYKNLHVVNWYGLAKQHADWFADDGVHQGALGARNYVRLIVEKVGVVHHIQ